MNPRTVLVAVLLAVVLLAFYLLVAWPLARKAMPDSTRVVTIPSGQYHADVFLADVARLWEQTAADHDAWFAELERQETERRKAEARKAQARRARAASVVRVRTTGVDWDAIARCESGGRWDLNTGNGYFGGLQWLPSTWRSAGGTGMPHHASRETQIAVAERLIKGSRRALLHHWPTCGRLG